MVPAESPRDKEDSRADPPVPVERQWGHSEQISILLDYRDSHPRSSVLSGPVQLRVTVKTYGLIESGDSCGPARIRPSSVSSLDLRELAIGHEFYYPLGMDAVRSLLTNADRVLGRVGEVIRYAPIFPGGIVFPKAILAARVLATESQF